MNTSSLPFESSAPLHDPAGLLARSPELRALAGRVPALRRAIERGSTEGAYRALFWASLLRKLGDLAATGKALLARRRIFVRPLNGAPAMFTLNGVGTSLYGRDDFDTNDGTYVATLFVVALFVPIFPIASYLVRDGQGGGFRRSWGFLAKVPLGAGAYLWQRAVALSLLGLLAVGVANAFEGYGHGTIHVVNGLVTPVRVELAGASPLDLAAGATGTIRADVGSHGLRVQQSGRTIESARVDVPRGGPGLVWNVLGAAPIYVEHVVYVAKGQSDASAENAEPELYCGESLVNRSGVDYVLTEPPKQLSMPENTPNVRKLHLGVAPGGMETCTGWLWGHAQRAKAIRLATQVAAAERLPAAMLGDTVESILAQASMEDGEAFAKDLLARDDSIEAHRVYQNLLFFNDLRPRAIAEYDARLAARPNDPDAEYLALRARTVEDERKRIDALVARYPDHAFLRRVQLWVHYVAREFSATVAAGEALRRLSPPMWRESLARHVEALVALGRGQDALDLAREAAANSSQAKAERRPAEVLAFRVANRIGASQPLEASDEDDAANLPLVQAATGIEVAPAAVERVKSEHAREALRIVLAARTDPEKALALVRNADARSIGALPQVVSTLLFAEAVRREEDGAFVRKLAPSWPARFVDGMVSYVTGGVLPEDIADLPLEILAALDFARSRSARLPAKDRRDSLERAKQADVLHGPVTVAIQGWPS